MITDGRILRNMTKAGFIEWKPMMERHWTGQTVKRCWVAPGPKLNNWFDVFEYRGREYRLRYVDGCFHPFVFRLGDNPPAFV